MALKILNNGFVQIKTQKDAKEALSAFRDLKAEIDALKEESGLNELEKDAMAYKAAVQNFMKEKDVEQIQCDGFHATLIKGAGSSRWITDEDDLTGNETDRNATLKECIEKKFKSKVTEKGSKARKAWMKITRRVADPSAIEEAVAEGLIDVDDISPAWVETPRAPYVRVFEDADG